MKFSSIILKRMRKLNCRLECLTSLILNVGFCAEDGRHIGELGESW